MRIYFALFVASFLLATTIAKAQETQLFLPLKKPAVRKFITPATQNFSFMQVIDSSKIIVSKSYLPVNFYSTHLGAMCKMELKLEKQIKLPLRIRLGSKEQVDYLEGKYKRH